MKQSKNYHENNPGFTLVELLVVIAIIGILIALLLPAINMAREAGRRSTCRNNIKQVLLGINNYHDANKEFPTAGTDPESGPHFGPGIVILPFIEEKALFDLVDKVDTPW